MRLVYRLSCVLTKQNRLSCALTKQNYVISSTCCCKRISENE